MALATSMGDECATAGRVAWLLIAYGAGARSSGVAASLLAAREGRITVGAAVNDVALAAGADRYSAFSRLRACGDLVLLLSAFQRGHSENDARAARAWTECTRGRRADGHETI